MRDISEPVRKFFTMLCSYRSLTEEFHAFLLERMDARYFAHREILFDYQQVVSDAVFVSSGYLLVYGFNATGDRQLLAIYPAGSIYISKSFIHQLPSDLEKVVSKDSYMLSLSYQDLSIAFARFAETDSLVRLIIADYAHRQQQRMLLLKESAEQVIQDFYKAYPEFLRNGLLVDADIASYLLIGDQTLRNVRMRLIREGKL